MATQFDQPIRAVPSAHLDSAHKGDIVGALGTIREHAPNPIGWRKRLITLLAIMGPGLVVMIGDNDAGGVATYAQAGQNYGTSLLWTLFLLIPVLLVSQEMVIRLGLVSGVGHARLILITVTGSFRRWERFMYVLIVVNLMVIPLAVLGHPSWGQVAHDWFVPNIQGGLTSPVLLLIICIVGTAVSPWQLCFQQSNVIDKRLTPRWYRYEFIDSIIGSVFTQIGAAGLMIVCAFAFAGTKLAGQFVDAGAVATGLSHTIGPAAGALFAVFLLDAALIGAAAVTLSTSYALGDVFSVKHSLHRSLWDGKAFYAIYAGLVIAAGAIVLIPNAPLGLMTLAVQVRAGVLVPSATVFLLLLCNDKAVLGPWVNKTWLNIAASLIIGVLVMLSLILASTVLFPAIDAVVVTAVAGAVLVLALVAVGLVLRRRERQARATEQQVDRAIWRMPPLFSLAPPEHSRARNIGLLVLRGYLILVAVLVGVKFAQLIGGFGH